MCKVALKILATHAPAAAAVFVAVKNKMDLAIGVALGSSIQIAIFVIPVTVLAGWAMGRPFTLDFDTFSVLMLTGGRRRLSRCSAAPLQSPHPA